MTAYVKALEQDNQELRSVGGRSSKTTSLSEIHEVAASAVATNKGKGNDGRDATRSEGKSNTNEADNSHAVSSQHQQVPQDPFFRHHPAQGRRRFL